MYHLCITLGKLSRSLRRVKRFQIEVSTSILPRGFTVNLDIPALFASSMVSGKAGATRHLLPSPSLYTLFMYKRPFYDIQCKPLLTSCATYFAGIFLLLVRYTLLRAVFLVLKMSPKKKNAKKGTPKKGAPKKGIPKKETSKQTPKKETPEETPNQTPKIETTNNDTLQKATPTENTPKGIPDSIKSVCKTLLNPGSYKEMYRSAVVPREETPTKKTPTKETPKNTSKNELPKKGTFRTGCYSCAEKETSTPASRIVSREDEPPRKEPPKNKPPKVEPRKQEAMTSYERAFAMLDESIANQQVHLFLQPKREQARCLKGRSKSNDVQ